MTHSLLWLRDISLSPETRWWLWQWSRHIGLDRAVTCTVRALLARLQVPARQGQIALKALKEAAWIEATPTPEGRGRPCYTYRVAPSLLAELDATPQPRVPLADCIEAVSDWDASADQRLDHATTEQMTPVDGVSNPADLVTRCDNQWSLAGSDGEEGDKVDLLSPLSSNLRKGHVRKHQLTSTNRWLVMVLLAHSDRAGQVMGLSFSALEPLTGMGRSQLHSQLGKLKRLELLSHYQPGRMGLGGKRTSLFKLNLSHSAFGRCDRLCVDLMISTPRRKGAPLPPMTVINGMAEALFVLAMLERSSPEGEVSHRISGDDKAVYEDAKHLLPSGIQLGDLGPWLAEQYEEALAHWLQCRLQAYALQLLAGSDGNETLSLEEAAVHHPDLIQAIVEDFPRWPQVGSLDDDPGAVPPQAAFFYRLARHLARELRALLMLAGAKHDAVDLRSLDLCLVPDNRFRQATWRLCGFAKHQGEPSSNRYAVILDPVKSDFALWIRRRKQASVWGSSMAGLPGSQSAPHRGEEATDSDATVHLRLQSRQW